MCQGFPILPSKQQPIWYQSFAYLKTHLSQARKIPKKWEGKENQIKTDNLNQKQSICYKAFAFSPEKQESRIQGAVTLITTLGFFSAYIPPELYSARL